uniref:SNF2 domain-containing protein CLASSY 4-like n=1 Tax=Kalanchoe fedtschenkoi TaxID=63787 RepID=A0A7N0TDQ4_KALFE
MKGLVEAEYLAAVAKRTRAGTDRFLVAKCYGDAIPPNLKRRRRVPEVEILHDETASLRGKATRKRRKKSVPATSTCRRGEEPSGDDVPDAEIPPSPPVSADDGDEDCWFVRDEGVSGVKNKCRSDRKGKGKWVEPDDIEAAVKSKMVVSDELRRAGESESVWDNDESNGRGKNRRLGGKDVGDSVGSRTGFQSPARPNADSEDTWSVSIGRSSADNEGVESGDGEDVAFSCDEVSSTDTQDDESDEDYHEHMADSSSNSEPSSGSDSEFELEEFVVDDKGREESLEGKHDENASPCFSDDVVILHETTSQGVDKGVSSPRNKKEILDEDIPFHEDGSCGEFVSRVKVTVNNETGTEKGCVSYPYEVDIMGEKITSKQKVCCTEPSTLVDRLEMDGAEDVEKGFLSGRNKEDKLDGKNSFTEKGSCSNSAPTVKGFKKNRTKVENLDWVVSEEKSYSLKTESTKCFQHPEESTKNRPNLEATFAWDEGTAGISNRCEVKCKKPYSEKRATGFANIDAFDIIFNSLTDKRGAIDEDVDKVTNVINATTNVEEEDHIAPKSSLPQSFTFGVKKPVEVEKSDFEQELDNLWDEFQFAIRADEIGHLARGTEKSDKDTASKNDKIYPTCCNRGEHEYALDDEIGIRCLICSFVQLEIKYVMPGWAKFSSRKFDTRALSDDEDPEVFDRLQFQNSKDGESSSCSDGTVWNLIPGVKEKLYQHQQDGFEFIWTNLMGTIKLDELRSSANNGMGGCIISHAPGTGKTRLTIEFLLSYLELFPCSCPLIIAPAGMLLTWEAEFKKWGVGIPFHNLNSSVLSGKEDIAASNIFNASKHSGNTNLLRLLKLYSWKKQKSILGLSYSLFEKLAGQRFVGEKESQSGNKKMIDEQVQNFGKIILEQPGLLVLDEGHTPRNPRSRIYKALTNIQTKKRIILSGTPFQNNLAELYTILSFVRPDFAQTISPELKKFCQKKLNLCSRRSRSESDVGNDDRAAILQLGSKIDPFVHVHKGSVLQESLPGLKDCVIVLNPPHYQKQIVEKIEANSYTNFEFEHKLSLGTIHPSLLLLTEKDESVIDKAKLEACRLDPNEGVKTRFLFEMIRLSEANNEKVLVFSQYLDPLGLIKEQVCSLLKWHEGIEVLQLVGRMEQEQRQMVINVFNDPHSSAKLLLASTKACSEGINLIGASRVILLDVVWNPSVERQAISRAFRLGQKKVVYSYNLIVGRMEWEKYCAQTNKDYVSNLVFCSNDESEKRYRVLSEDKILDELISHKTLEDMFEQIVYYPKDSMFS